MKKIIRFYKNLSLGTEVPIKTVSKDKGKVASVLN
jgi:hypothetical protein